MSEKSRITFASVDQAKLPFNLVLQGNAGTPAGTIKIDKELVTFEGNFYAVSITDGSQNMHDGLLMASVSPDEADNSFAVFAMVGYYMAAEIEALRKRVSELETKTSAEEAPAPSVAITLPANLRTEDLR